MPKQILVDFRGGLNKKISPHMIGDTQGQDANNLDMGAVRLQGRRQLDTSQKAAGNFFYEVGSANNAGRWVSSDQADTATYIDYSSDFAVWNRDLYVALSYKTINNQEVAHSTGEIEVFRDGGSSPVKLSFDPPASATVTGGIVANTTLEPEITGQDAIDSTAPTTVVTAEEASTLQWGTVSSALYKYTPTNTVASGVDAGDSSRTWYVWQKKDQSNTVVSSEYFAQTNSASGSSQLHTRTPQNTVVTYTLTEDTGWTYLGYVRSSWNERDNHPDSPSTAPATAYWKFTKGENPLYDGADEYYQHTVNETLHTIASGGDWSDVREDPNYSLPTTTMENTSVKWEKTGGGSGTELKISQAD